MNSTMRNNHIKFQNRIKKLSRTTAHNHFVEQRREGLKEKELENKKDTEREG